MKHPLAAAGAVMLLLTAGAPAAYAQSARDLYTRALAQERNDRDAANDATMAQMRRVVAAYESVVRRHPASGYSDNALWQAGNLAALAYQRFGDDADRKTAARLFQLLAESTRPARWPPRRKPRFPISPLRPPRPSALLQARLLPRHRR